MSDDRERPDDDALRARLKSLRSATPPADLVDRVRAIAVHGASVHHEVEGAIPARPIPAGGPIRGVVSPRAAASPRRRVLGGWADLLAPFAGVVLLAWLLGGALGAFSSANLFGRLAESGGRPGPTGDTGLALQQGGGSLPDFVLLAAASLVVVLLLLELSRGAPTFRRWVR
jgi:hypothetical protein